MRTPGSCNAIECPDLQHFACGRVTPDPQPTAATFDMLPIFDTAIGPVYPLIDPLDGGDIEFRYNTPAVEFLHLPPTTEWAM